MKMKNLFINVLFIFLASEIFAQPYDIQAGIFNSGSTLIVKAIPGSTINNLVFSGVNFTIRWREDYGVSLGTLTTSFGIVKNGSENTHISNSINYRYQIFSGIPNVNVSWNAGQEITLISIPVNQTGFGSGIFELAPSDFLPGSGEEWYIEIGGINRTNPVFNPASTGEVPLPVQISMFDAALIKKGNVKLTWETASESNSFMFEVERKSFTINNSSIWEKIGSVAAAGNSNTTKNYSFIDSKAVGSTKFYYRIKLLDIDGSFDYSNEIELDATPNQFVLYQNYPNPFNPSTKIDFSIPTAAKVNLRVYNQLGEMVKELINEFLEPGTYQTIFDASGYASGLYIYKLQVDEQVFVKKMQLLK